MKTKIQLFIPCFIMLLMSVSVVAQKEETGIEKKKSVSDFTLVVDDTGEKILNLIPVEKGIYRVEIVNPMGIKSSELLSNQELTSGQKRSWKLEARTFTKAGDYYFLLYKNDQFERSLKHRILPEMPMME